MVRRRRKKQRETVGVNGILIQTDKQLNEFWKIVMFAVNVDILMRNNQFSFEFVFKSRFKFIF